MYNLNRLVRHTKWYGSAEEKKEGEGKVEGGILKEEKKKRTDCDSHRSCAVWQTVGTRRTREHVRSCFGTSNVFKTAATPHSCMTMLCGLTTTRDCTKWHLLRHDCGQTDLNLSSIRRCLPSAVLQGFKSGPRSSPVRCLRVRFVFAMTLPFQRLCLPRDEDSPCRVCGMGTRLCCIICGIVDSRPRIVCSVTPTVGRPHC